MVAVLEEEAVAVREVAVAPDRVEHSPLEKLLAAADEAPPRRVDRLPCRGELGLASENATFRAKDQYCMCLNTLLLK